jgi:hypothetical protein
MEVPPGDNTLGNVDVCLAMGSFLASKLESGTTYYLFASGHNINFLCRLDTLSIDECGLRRGTYSTFTGRLYEGTIRFICIVILAQPPACNLRQDAYKT